MHQAHTLFVLDTNIFIEAHRRYYAQDLCPGFWECLIHYCQERRMLSIDRVRAELMEGPNNQDAPDKLAEWVKKHQTISSYHQRSSQSSMLSRK